MNLNVAAAFRYLLAVLALVAWSIALSNPFVAAIGLSLLAILAIL